MIFFPAYDRNAMTVAFEHLFTLSQ